MHTHTDSSVRPLCRSLLTASMTRPTCATHKEVPLAAAAALCLVVASCATEGDQATGMADASAVELERILTVGAEDNPGGILFGSIGGLVAIGGDGSIFVGDRQDPKIYAFAPDGELLATIGSVGAGPGEFTAISDIHVGPGDTLYVFDRRLNRISVIDPESFDFAYDVAVAEDSAGNSPGELVGVLDSGFVVTYDEPPVPGAGFGDERHMYARLVTRDGAAREKPLARQPSTEWLGILSGNSLSFSRRPYSGDPIFRLGPEGSLYAGNTRGREITISDNEGAERSGIAHSIEAIPITQRELDENLESYSQDMASRLRQAGLYRTRQFFSSFRVDDMGRIWIRPIPADPEAETSRWLILNAEGRVVGQAELPSGVHLQEICRGLAYAVDRTKGVSLAVYEFRS